MGSITPLEKKPKNKCRYWRLFVSLGFSKRTGKRIQKSKRFHGTYGEAKRELVKFEEECKGVVSEDITLGEHLDRWYKQREDKMRPATLLSERNFIRILKWMFGEDTKLRELTSEMIDEGFRDLLKNGSVSGRSVSVPYVGHIKSCLDKSLKDATKQGYLFKDPSENTERISKRSPERENIPTESEIKEMLNTLDCRDGKQMAVFLCATLGLRRNEALGLRWRNVDLENGVVNVCEALQVDGTISDPKTAESKRLLPIPDCLREAFEIRAAAAKMDIEVAKRNGLAEENSWADTTVCCDERGRHTTAAMASHWWARHRKAFGIKCGLHGLRHALLTNMAKKDVSPRVLQSVAGHASANTTLSIYVHSRLEDKQNAFAAIYDEEESR